MGELQLVRVWMGREHEGYVRAALAARDKRQ